MSSSRSCRTLRLEARDEARGRAHAGAVGVGEGDRREDLDAAIEQCLESDGPFFLDVQVAAEENCFPMIPAGQGHHEVLLAKDRPYVETGQAKP